VIYPGAPMALSLSPAFQGVSRDSKDVELDRLPELLGTIRSRHSRSAGYVPWGGMLLQVEAPCEQSKTRILTIILLQDRCQDFHSLRFSPSHVGLHDGKPCAIATYGSTDCKTDATNLDREMRSFTTERCRALRFCAFRRSAGSIIGTDSQRATKSRCDK